MQIKYIILSVMLAGCVTDWYAPGDFKYQTINTKYFDIATYQKLTDNNSPIYIFIEGDGYAFDARGRPTHNPTPRGTTMRDIATKTNMPNVVYMARPCQFVSDKRCTKTDWTSGRFSQAVIDATADAIKQIAHKRPVILTGYSGGAMVSGLVVQQHPEINVQKWVTIAGVLNHHDWTQYFGDAPLVKSENMTQLPQINQIHYVAEHDSVVPYELSKKWIPDDKIIIVPNTNHWNICISK